VSDIETTEVCVQNLHMHTFLAVDRFSEGRHEPAMIELSVRARQALGLHSEPFGQMRLWGVGDLLIT
jgi:hypothetical protein